jgi:hypothetical protein
MSLLRPLDPSFPIERQIAIEAGPVVLVNVFTLSASGSCPVPKTRRKQCCSGGRRSKSLHGRSRSRG